MSTTKKPAKKRGAIRKSAPHPARQSSGHTVTFSVEVQYGNHSIIAQVPAVPRPGDRIRCSFPASGIPRLFLEVTGVHFHQLSEFEGKECPEPFQIVVTTDGDPDQREHNDAAFKNLVTTDDK